MNNDWQLQGDKPWTGRTAEMDMAKPRSALPLIGLIVLLTIGIAVSLMVAFTRPSNQPTVIESYVTITPSQVTITATPTPTTTPEPTAEAPEPAPPEPDVPVQPEPVQPPVIQPAPPATQAPVGSPPVINSLSCTREGQSFNSAVYFDASGVAGTATITIGPVVLPNQFVPGTTSAQAFATISAHAQTCTATITTNYGTTTLSTTSN